MSEINFEHIGTPTTCTVLNSQLDVPDAITVVIAGVPRGGTTMVAAAIEALGVYLGPEDDLRNFTFEDQKMNRPYINEQHDRIKENDSLYNVWGWKDPGAIHPLRELSHALRNPRVILVFRDMLASIQGEVRFDEEHDISRSFDDLIDATLDRYQKNWDFVKKTRLPVLLVSYERAIQNKEDFVADVIDFLGIETTEEQRKSALDRISSKGGYYKW